MLIDQGLLPRLHQNKKTHVLKLTRRAIKIIKIILTLEFRDFLTILFPIFENLCFISLICFVSGRVIEDAEEKQAVLLKEKSKSNCSLKLNEAVNA